MMYGRRAVCRSDNCRGHARSVGMYAKIAVFSTPRLTRVARSRLVAAICRENKTQTTAATIAKSTASTCGIRLGLRGVVGGAWAVDILGSRAWGR